MIAVLWGAPLWFVAAAAPPPPMLVAFTTHHSKMALRPEPVHEDRQTMFLLFSQGGVERRRRIRDRFETLAPRHRVLATPPQPVDETGGLGLVLDFLMAVHGIFG